MEYLCHFFLSFIWSFTFYLSSLEIILHTQEVLIYHPVTLGNGQGSNSTLDGLRYILVSLVLTSTCIWYVQTTKLYKFLACHTVWHGSNKLGYNGKFDVCRLYDNNTYWIVGYDASQYKRIKCPQHAPAICVNIVVNNEAKQKQLGLAQVSCWSVHHSFMLHSYWLASRHKSLQQILCHPKFLKLSEFHSTLSLFARPWQPAKVWTSVQCDRRPPFWTKDIAVFLSPWSLLIRDSSKSHSVYKLLNLWPKFWPSQSSCKFAKISC